MNIDIMRETRDNFEPVLQHLVDAYKAAKACHADSTAQEIDTVYNNALDIWGRLQDRLDEEVAKAAQ